MDKLNSDSNQESREKAGMERKLKLSWFFKHIHLGVDRMQFETSKRQEVIRMLKLAIHLLSDNHIQWLSIYSHVFSWTPLRFRCEDISINQFVCVQQPWLWVGIRFYKSTSSNSEARNSAALLLDSQTSERAAVSDGFFSEFPWRTLLCCS